MRGQTPFLEAATAFADVHAPKNFEPELDEVG